MNIGMPRAYWVPVPASYLTAVGAITAQWGYFEMQFDGLIKILSRHPSALHLTVDMPRSFEGRARRFSQMANFAFTHAPTLAKRLSDFSIAARKLARKRNIFSHGFWFDTTGFNLDPPQGVTIMTKPDGTGDFYSVELAQLESLAVKIEALKTEGVMLLFPFGGEPFLTADEASALQRFHNDFPPPPATPVVRAPGSIGTPGNPQPFQA